MYPRKAIPASDEIGGSAAGSLAKDAVAQR